MTIYTVLAILLSVTCSRGEITISCGSPPSPELEFKGCFLTKDGANYVALGNESVTYSGLLASIVIHDANNCAIEINTTLVEGSYECGVLLGTPQSTTLSRATFGKFNVTKDDLIVGPPKHIPSVAPFTPKNYNKNITQRITSLKDFINIRMRGMQWVGIASISVLASLNIALLIGLLRVTVRSVYLSTPTRFDSPSYYPGQPPRHLENDACITEAMSEESRRRPSRVTILSNPSYQPEEPLHNRGNETDVIRDAHKGLKRSPSQVTMVSLQGGEAYQPDTSLSTIRCFCRGVDEDCPFLGSLV